MSYYIPPYSSYPLPIHSKYHVFRIGMPTDGSCLFHCIAYSCFIPYIQSDNSHRLTLVQTLRQELAQDFPAAYPKLHKGYLALTAQDVPEYSCSYMINELLTSNGIGHGFLQYLGETLNKDIYIIDAKTNMLYNTDEYLFSITKNRGAIVLYFISNHYELIAIKQKSKLVTFFSPQHSFIKHLQTQLRI